MTAPHPSIVPSSLSISATTGRAHVPYLKRHLHRAMPLLPVTLDVSLVLVGDVRMARLHEQFMNVAGTTDVLTFPLDDGEGEIFICVPFAVRESTRRGTSAAQELVLYAVHGMLHLCGHDDLSPSNYATMHAEEDRILTAIGVGPVFAASSGRKSTEQKGTALEPRRRKH